jgi:hypothetical protein
MRASRSSSARHGESATMLVVATLTTTAGDEGGGRRRRVSRREWRDRCAVSPRRGGDPSMSPRGRSKRRGATTSRRHRAAAVGDRVAECRGARRLLVEEEAHAADGSLAEALFCAQWRVALLLLRSGRRATAERVQAAHDGGQAVEGALQFELWPAGGGEAYAIMANDDVELIAWMQRSRTCATMR